MTESTSSQSAPRGGLLRNWLSMAGSMLALASLFAFVLLAVFDWRSREESPYLAILTYLVTPGFLVAGLLLMGLGRLWERRRAARGLVIDFSNERHRKRLMIFAASTIAFMLLTAIGSYQSYEATKSVKFCGEACHTAMEPQYVAYQHSPHAQVECVACHIGPGAQEFLKAKFNGVHQVYATVLGKVQRPITGGGNINIEQKTCEQCHWPKKYVGNLERTYSHRLAEPGNPEFSVRLLLRVGGGDPTHGPLEGIHWHMNLGNKVEYIATDKARQQIPWVRLTDSKGKVTVYKTKKFTDDPAQHKIHRMDCLDCHNRPAHQLRAPNDAVDLALALGRISTNLPNIKKTAVRALTGTYTNRAEAWDKIAAALRATYTNAPALDETITVVQTIYSQNFFPEMKADWRIYPNNIGHKDWPGCFRCHDNEHVAEDGRRKVRGSECNDCHFILAQGKGQELLDISTKAVEFKHPAEGWEGSLCTECHNGKVD